MKSCTTCRYQSCIDTYRNYEEAQGKRKLLFKINKLKAIDLKNAKKEGLQQGKEEGLAEGLQQGIKKKVEKKVLLKV